MSKSKSTSNSISSLAAQVLNNPNSSKIQKQLAGSALSQSGTKNSTGSKMETTASNALTSNKYNSTTKKLAGSVLSQSNK